MEPTEQDRILDHAVGLHGRILAGPGTGKSTTVLRLAQRLLATSPAPALRVITFTRAATSELIAKIREEGGATVETTTLHSFALSLLMQNPGVSGLPEPLRVPDDWETRTIVHRQLAAYLRTQGFTKVRVTDIAQLEREMAARWESLDPDLVLLADVDPRLRNAYIAAWRRHRAVFGYSLFAEMPLGAHQAIEDHGRELKGVAIDLLVVDEYQDLNRSEIQLAFALAECGTSVLAVGDDDQSIYSWRMAAPEGIRSFLADIAPCADYTLSVSFRCGSDILSHARGLIETTPGRPQRPPLRPGPDNPTGEVQYLRFANQDDERRAVALLARHLIDDHKLKPNEIVVLFRGDSRGAWSRPLRLALDEAGVAATDVEAALEPLSDASTRELLAVARLATNREDSLAWCTLMMTEHGVSERFVNALIEEAHQRRVTFAQRLLQCDTDPPADVPPATVRRANRRVAEVQAFLDQLQLELAGAEEEGWAPWLLDAANALGIDVSDAFDSLAREVGRVTPQETGLGHFLNQLEPVTKDLALLAEGVSIMTMARSKGLTFRAAIVMGVEDGVIPSPRSDNIEEERRLLYVAMTRAREFLFLTMAQFRRDPTAHTGRSNQGSRGRTPLFYGLDLQPTNGPAYLRNLRRARSTTLH